MHTSASPFYSETMRGSVRAHVARDATYTWRNVSGEVIAHGSSVYDLSPGVYHVTAVADGSRAHAAVEVTRARLPTVLAYLTTPATHENAWDGSVVASVCNVSTHAYRWSTGAITVLPELRDVPPGDYSVSILDAKHRVVPFMHACGPATVTDE